MSVLEGRPILEIDDLPAALQAALPTLMRRAITAARSADFPFGCVLADVESGQFLLEAANKSSTDPTAHAEMNALRGLSRVARSREKIVVVSTAEPCPMCAAACWWSGVGAIVFGTSIDTLIRLGWRQIDKKCADLLSAAHPPGHPIILGGYLSEETDPLYIKKP